MPNGNAPKHSDGDRQLLDPVEVVDCAFPWVMMRPGVLDSFEGYPSPSGAQL